MVDLETGRESKQQVQLAKYSALPVMALEQESLT